MTAMTPGRRPATSSPSLPATVRGVIFDGDDTLWLTEGLYDDARDRARAIVAEAGLDGERWEAIQRERDLHNVAGLGHSPERFPTSCVEAVDLLGEHDGDVDLERVRSLVREEAATVFDVRAPLRDDAEESLQTLSARGVRLALLTKGDERVQRTRVERSGLGSYFDVVEIVERKSPEVFGSVARSLGLATGEVISVGNSVESDILPSQEAGIWGAWLPAYVWDYERRHDPAVEADLHRITTLSEVVDLVVGRR